MSSEVMNKESWVALFREIGLNDDSMRDWHRKFEAKHPDGHQSFLEWLGIREEEIRTIRAM